MYGIANNNAAAVAAAGQMQPNYQYNPDTMGYVDLKNPYGSQPTMQTAPTTSGVPAGSPAPVNITDGGMVNTDAKVMPSTSGMTPKTAQETNAANIKETYKADVKSAADIQTSLTKMQSLMPKYDAIISSIESAPDMMFGKVAGQISPQVSPQAQDIASMAKELVLLDKEAKNMGSQGFTDTDRQFLEDIQGGLTVKKPAALAILKRLKSQSENDFNLGKQKLDLFNKTGSMAGAEKLKAGLPEGAKQAPDGNYYIQKNGKYYRVD